MTKTGIDNPNYRHGHYSDPPLCACGGKKDYRAKRCSRCAGCSKPQDNKPFVSAEVLRTSIQKAKSLWGAAILAGVSRQTVTRFVQQNAIDISHFTATKGRQRTDNQIFSLKLVRDPTTRKYFLSRNPTAYLCIKCGQLPWWNGKELTLQMDHINGNSLDDRLSNLRWLCPNCHTQTDTFTGRNAHHRAERSRHHGSE